MTGQNTDIPLPVKQFHSPLGAQIICGDVRNLSDDLNETLLKHAHDNLVLLFRNQSLDDSEFLKFASRFGKLRLASKISPGRKPLKNPYILVISNVIEDGLKLGSLGDGELSWHTDNSYTEAPPSFSFLYSKEIPKWGGETSFLNMYAAYDSLPAGLKGFIQGKTIKQDTSDVGYDTGASLVNPIASSRDVRELPGINLPIVRTHPGSRHNALYLGRRHNAYINGCSVEESECTLDELWAHATQDRFSWEHNWAVGDIIIWDNRCVMHRRNSFDPESRRIMHRTLAQGEMPILAELADGAAHARGNAFLSIQQLVS